jgi:hypothetical protein
MPKASSQYKESLVGWLLAMQDWEYFLTATFAKEEVTYSGAQKRFWKWLTQCQRSMPRLRAFAAIEHGIELWHLHILVAPELNDLQRHTLERAWSRHYGHMDVERIRPGTVHRVVSYAVKDVRSASDLLLPRSLVSPSHKHNSGT